jgi:hypothetical protein
MQLKPGKVCTPPSDEACAYFMAFFKNTGDVDAVGGTSCRLVDPSLVVAMTAIPKQNNGFVSVPCKITAWNTNYICDVLTCFGMTEWQPNLCEDSDSIWNQACCCVCLDTFEELIMKDTYLFLCPDKTLITQLVMMATLYNNNVHHRQQGQFNHKA